MDATKLTKSHQALSVLHAKQATETMREALSSSSSPSTLSSITSPLSSASEPPALGEIQTGDSESTLFFNAQVPEFWETCVHEVIQQRCKEAPESSAVAAWDGSFTYGELDDLSNRLASSLILLGVKAETFVPICMEKSRWATVAILGVMKAGGAFTLLDPSYPLPRLKTICEELSSLVVLSSTAQSERCTQLANVIVVEHLCRAWHPGAYLAQSPATVCPSNVLYVAFTSGSTGKPKGVLIEHRAYSSGAREHLKVFQIDQASRVLQFSSYAFDVNIMETLSTLMAGGCLCVVGEAQRSDVSLFAEAVDEMQVSHAMLTPSFARTVPWENVRHLRVLILGGEEMRQSDAAICAERGVRLINAYGAAECSVNATARPGVQPGDNLSTIGHATGAIAWIVDPDDPERQMGPGTAGELLLEGPIVGRGYLNSPEMTARVFIDPPKWLRQLRMMHYQHQLYRTGDLAVQDSTGALTLLGRKEGQVKIRGQRVELAEIEQHIDQVLTAATEVVVEKVTAECDQRDVLMAFVQTGRAAQGWTEGSPFFLPPRPASIQEFSAAQSQLREQLPRYMIPAIFIGVSCIPRTPSGKADRRLLRMTAARLSRKELREFAGSPIDGRPPSTAAEHALQQLYADVLELPLLSISVDDSFVRLGGDSIMAVRLVGAARLAGLVLDIRDVLGTARLEEQARKATPVSEETTCETYVPFSLLGSRCSDRDEVLRLAAEQCGTSPSEIEDIYPCTPLQEGMLALSSSQPQMYVGQIVFGMPEDVDVSQFKAAWQSTADATPILRTRIIHTPQGLLQVVLRGRLVWETYNKTPEACASVVGSQIGSPGAPLIRFALGDGDHRGEFALTVHHAVWDAWTMRLIHDALERSFQGEPTKKHPFHPFIQYLQQVDGATMDDFWRTELADLEAPSFPALPSTQHRPAPTAMLRHTVEKIEVVARIHTMASYIHLAWSLLVAHYTDSTEAVHGAIVSGRNAPVADINELAGPTIATVPVRVRVRPEDTISAALEQIQTCMVRMVPHEQAGLLRIAKTSPDAARACSFQSHLNIQVVEQEHRLLPARRGIASTGMELTRFSSYALNLLIQLTPDNTSVTVDIAYDPQVLSAWQVDRMIHQWEHILRQICREPSGSLQELDFASPLDRDLLRLRNAETPTVDWRCLHDLVLAQEARQPSRQAVSAWDGDFTYQELAELSSNFARLLNLFAVGRGSFVPICMDKSRWAIVSILAVLQTGATCVLLDPQHPRQRMQDTIAGLSVPVLVNAPSTAPVTRGLSAIELCVSAKLTEQLWTNPYGSRFQTHVDPDDLAFLIFTSGSTGVPKGIAMPHCTVSSSIYHNSAPMMIDADTRTLHFSSYAFDVSIYEIFTTLAAGGCVCVPSEFQRTNELADFIQQRAVNWTFLTPSTAQSLHPSEVPGLATLVLGGEAVTPDHVKTWAPGRSLINGYGPAEATICAVGRMPEHGWVPGNIGHVVGGVGWVTIPSDPSRLAAIGAIGELLLEGPFLARGYLNQHEATAASFISPPPWRRTLLPGCDADTTRLYRTGDLVQYEEDGSIRYIGRRDTQLKLRGQRIDLGEIETQLRRSFPGVHDVVAEAIQLPILQDRAALVAFIGCQEAQVTESAVGEQVLSAVDAGFQHAVSVAQSRLQAILPPYMLPSVFFPLAHCPKTLTGKTDRRCLRQAVLSLPPHELQLYRVAGRQKTRVPVSRGPELRLQSIWADLLHIPCDEIGSDDTFLLHGGDSVAAMRMVALARRADFTFRVTDVLSNCTLSELARCTGEEPCLTDGDGPLPTTHELEAADQVVASPVSTEYHTGLTGANLGTDAIAVYPTTQAQSFLIKRYPWTHWRFSFHGEVSVKRLRTACARLVAAHSIMRTLFVAGAGGERVRHVVMKELDIPLHTGTTHRNLEEYCQSICDAEQEMDVLEAVLPTRLTLISDALHTSHIFILRLSHAQYDGICVPKIFADLEALYNGTEPIAPTRFERYLDERRWYDGEHAHAFWKEYLAGSSPPCTMPVKATPPTNSDGSRPSAPLSIISASQTVPYTAFPFQVTLATVVKAAACLVLARLTGRTDITVGQTVNGRSLPQPWVSEVVGPCVNYIPFRATLSQSMSIQDYLVHMQSQHNRCIRYDGAELDAIIKSCTTWDPTTEFGFILQHQNIDMDLSLTLDGNRCASCASSGRLRPSNEVWICSTPCPSGVDLDVFASSQTLTADAAKSLVDDIADMIQTLLYNLQTPLRDVVELD
ncbi:nonribosomal peptide synthetase ftmA [Aspergillus puulaauensis]|uniref:Non-ribosomal peptide synthetase n=1 Tax=Aspergillus puulaauensis TaxID=1220207 RepID=A0A7R8AJW7_9EURO|nr:non-ribosomal peptide synthetase [Aspergillus puulaauensis]BCS21596.1 non-ribosomal peptide synthetase [Aspergillus puulaauensis]